MEGMSDQPLISISIHLPPPAGKKGRKKSGEGKARKALAREKLKKEKDDEKDEKES